jgi:glycosyltransferase involved in cell wall biosynthesis
MTDLSILMPVFNERDTVETAVSDVAAARFPVDEFELVVVDDGSTDGTRELLAEREWPPWVRVLHHDRNRGKGAAVRTAISAATGTYAAILDADLEYDPSQIATLLEPLIAGEAEAVYGVRGFQAHTAYGFWYTMGNKLVTLAANVAFDSWLADIMTCYKVTRTDLLRSLPLREPGFGIEPEITGRLLQAGVQIHEVPITYKARTREAGKKLTARDGLRVLWVILRCRLRPN